MNSPKKPNETDGQYTRRRFLKSTAQSALVVGFGAGLTSCDGSPTTNVKVSPHAPGSVTIENITINNYYNSSGQRRAKVAMLSLDEFEFSNDGTEDLIVGHFTDDPTTIIILEPGQSVLITDPEASTGTLENTSSTSITVGTQTFLPGATGTWTKL